MTFFCPKLICSEYCTLFKSKYYRKHESIGKFKAFMLSIFLETFLYWVKLSYNSIISFQISLNFSRSFLINFSTMTILLQYHFCESEMWGKCKKNNYGTFRGFRMVKKACIPLRKWGPFIWINLTFFVKGRFSPTKKGNMYRRSQYNTSTQEISI